MYTKEIDSQNSNLEKCLNTVQFIEQKEILKERNAQLVLPMLLFMLLLGVEPPDLLYVFQCSVHFLFFFRTVSFTHNSIHFLVDDFINLISTWWCKPESSGEHFWTYFRHAHWSSFCKFAFITHELFWRSEDAWNGAGKVATGHS